MRENINKVSQRGERLDSLQDKTDNLAVSAQGFRRGANRVRKQVSLFSCNKAIFLWELRSPELFQEFICKTPETVPTL